MSAEEADDRLNSKVTWIDQISGSFKHDPEFEEILRLGREIRRAKEVEP